MNTQTASVYANAKIPTIEVVEDDLSLRKALRDKLMFEGFEVLQARDGEEGLATALREEPDLILLDIAMPRMSGLTMMKKLRQKGQWGRKVPVILLTNLAADDEEINQAITDDEPAYYLVKSNWTLNDLMEKIRERISRENFFVKEGR